MVSNWDKYKDALVIFRLDSKLVHKDKLSYLTKVSAK